MSTPNSLPDSDLIVAHVPFVRALARALVFDAELAKDVEQEVLLAALQNAPRDQRSIKGWLASIVRHLASKSFRARTRRDARESGAATALVPTPAEILAREDLRRSLVEHVLALDEPVRAVMILRFFEDLPPREVARRLGIPVETVRTRTKRGVDVLRGRLERESGGGRGAWCLALVTGLKLQPPNLLLAGATVLGAGLPGVLAMGMLKKVAVVAAILAMASTVWIAIERGEPALPAQEAVSAAPRPSELVRPTTDAPADAVVEESRTAIDAASSPETLAKAAPTTGSLRLVLHWFDGTPAAQVNAQIIPGGLDSREEVADVATGDDGTRLVEALAPGPYEVQFDRGPSEPCDVVAGETVELEVTFARGFDVSGRVVELGGRTVGDAEILLYWGMKEHVVGRTDAQGRFEIRSLREGIQWISARAPLHGPSKRRELMGGATGFEDVELVLEPSGASLAGIVYDADGKPLPNARVLVGPDVKFELIHFEDGGRGLTPPGQVAVCDENGNFVFAGVPVGRHPVQAQAKGHSPWSGEVEMIDQRTARLEIRLVRGTTLTGRVTDTSGAPVVRAEVRGNGAYVFASRFSRSGKDGTFSMRDLPAGEFQVSVQADGHESAETTLQGAPGAQLTWDPILGSGTSISGRLVMANTDFSQWHVSCESQDRPAGDYQQPSFRESVKPTADGRFEIRGCGDVAHRITVRAPESDWSFPTAWIDGVRPGGPELVITIDPTLLLTCKLRGRILSDLGEPQPGIQFIVGREGSPGAPVLTAGADGTFDLEDLPTGKYAIGVYTTGFAPFISERVDVAAGTTWDFGDLQLQRGGTLAVRLTRDAALAKAELWISAGVPGSGRSFGLPVHGEEARSEVLTPGEYLVEVRGKNEADGVAQRSARATVRAGEETLVELHVGAGASITLAFLPPGTAAATIQALDAAGTVLWEDRVAPGKLALPLLTARLVARDDTGRSTEVPLGSLASSRAQVVTLEFK